MSYSYELRVDSRDVNIPIAGGIGKHTGYELITYDENHNVVNIQTVALFEDNGKIVFKDGNYDVNIPLGADVIPPQMYQDKKWVETTPKWIQDNDFKSAIVPLSSEEALSVFQNIQRQTDLINKLGEMGLSLDYDPMNQNCNSWTSFINYNLFPKHNIFDLLNSNLDIPDIYQGYDCSFPYVQYSDDENIFQLILDLLNYLDENNLTLDDINLSVSNLLYGYKVTVDYAGEQIVFTSYLSFATPVYSLQELYDTAERTTSPLIVDLDGDGVETTSVADGVYFDHDGNGFAALAA